MIETVEKSNLLQVFTQVVWLVLFVWYFHDFLCVWHHCNVEVDRVQSLMFVCFLLQAKKPKAKKVKVDSGLFDMHHVDYLDHDEESDYYFSDDV